MTTAQYKGVVSYVGQVMLGRKLADRHKNNNCVRSDFGWRLHWAIEVLQGRADVVIWEKWGDYYTNGDNKEQP